MKATLQQIQDQIAFEVDGNASITSTDSDWGQRLSPINRALFDWANSYDWESLKRVYNGKISTSTGNASLALPADFERPDSIVKIVSDGSNLFEYAYIDPSKTDEYTDTSKYVYLLGDNNTGRVMYINADTLASGASIQFTYYASPISLVSAGSLVACPDPAYITQRALYYIYKSGEDNRFPEAKVEADRIMARMIENEAMMGIGHKESSVPTWQQASGFRIGRD